MSTEKIWTRNNDPLYAEARQIVVEHGQPTISRIQRMLRIGYNHAARLLEAMEGDVVTVADSTGVRQMICQDATGSGVKADAAATKVDAEAAEIQRLRLDAITKLREAEKAWHAFYAALPVGDDRTFAAEVFERVRCATRR